MKSKRQLRDGKAVLTNSKIKNVEGNLYEIRIMNNRFKDFKRYIVADNEKVAKDKAIREFNLLRLCGFPELITAKIYVPNK